MAILFRSAADAVVMADYRLENLLFP